VPTFEWENPLGLIRKCQFCKERLGEGQKPACAEACPNGALRFGKREALLAQAHAQIESNPGRYVRRVYGETEAGGTSMLYLSAVPFDQLGFPKLGPEPIPYQAEAVMQQTPVIALTVASLTSALAWFLKRREQHLAQASAHTGEETER
jgi:formate dehydrogenase iron-sulfur subunit